MDDLIVYAIVLGAALYLARWFYKNLVSMKSKQPACSSCDSCEPESSPSDAQTATVSSADHGH